MLQILDFHATWCGPCKMLSPVLDAIEKENTNINIKKLNVDENKELVTKYGVTSVPTVIFVKNDQEVSRFNGVQSKEKIQSLINQYK